MTYDPKKTAKNPLTLDQLKSKLGEDDPKFAGRERKRERNLSLGRQLAKARNEAKLTQRALSETTGIAQSQIAQIEVGLGNPTWDTIEQICDAIGLDVLKTHDAA